jgi:hypothetical protein
VLKDLAIMLLGLGRLIFPNALRWAETAAANASSLAASAAMTTTLLGAIAADDAVTSSLGFLRFLPFLSLNV